MSFQLSKESFIALAAIAWADERMSRREAEGLLRAAREGGLDGDDLEAVRRATESPVGVSDFDASGMSEWERGLTYALACWLSRVDGHTNAEEADTLERLGDALDFPKSKRAAAYSAAFDIACLEGGNKPEKFDFARLVEHLAQKLPSLRRGE
ncbi:MAG: TerB family tellurite resistance protein [Myxococcales bacterium]|nr:TerB family tellurite resistance protein [Myxococcales bacterium]